MEAPGDAPATKEITAVKHLKNGIHTAKLVMKALILM